MLDFLRQSEVCSARNKISFIYSRHLPDCLMGKHCFGGFCSGCVDCMDLEVVTISAPAT